MKAVTEIDRKFDEATGAASVDPVCGMTVDPNSAAGSFEYKGQTYYFCSAHCLNKFRHDPESFIKEPTETTSIEPPETQPKKLSQPGYTCPMHPEVRQEGPGSCPKCGMALGADYDSRAEGEDRIHVSHASSDSSRCARQLSDLRNGARTKDHHTRRGRES